MSTATLRIFPKGGRRTSLAALALAGCGKPPQQAPPPPEVTVQTVGNEPVPLELTYPARTVRVARGRSARACRRHPAQAPLPGRQPREAGPADVPDRSEPVRARLASARAEVAVAKARLDEARRKRDRMLPLFEKNAVSQSRRDEASSGFEVAQANCGRPSRSSAGAAGPEYTDVRAPISGLTSREVLLRRQPGLDRTAVEPADQDRAGRSAVRRVRGARGRSGAPAQRSDAGERGAAAGREADPGRRQRIPQAAQRRRSSTTRVELTLRHRARARGAAEQGRAADSGPVRSHAGRRRQLEQRRSIPRKARDGRPAGRVRLGGRRGREGADAPGAARPQRSATT